MIVAGLVSHAGCLLLALPPVPVLLLSNHLFVAAMALASPLARFPGWRVSDSLPDAYGLAKHRGEHGKPEFAMPTAMPPARIPPTFWMFWRARRDSNSDPQIVVRCCIRRNRRGTILDGGSTPAVPADHDGRCAEL